MTAVQWTLNLAFLAWVLLRNLGTRPLDRAAFTVPLVVVAVAAGAFLRDVPTAGNDVALDLILTAAGLVLGVVAAALTRVRCDGGRVVVSAGPAFAALWVVVIGGRIAFAEWATGSGSHAVGHFSRDHHITGADAWTAAFVLMALAMVAGRLLTTAVVASRRRPTAAVPAPAAA